MYDKVTERLTALGFTEQKSKIADLAAMSKAVPGGDMNADGPYSVLGVWERDGMSVVLERNVSPDTRNASDDEPQTLTTHPATLVVDSPRGRCAVRPSDLDTLAEVIKALG